MAIRFYSWPMSSGSRVHWALEELGIPYDYVQLDRAKNEHRQPEFLAINPNGKVPALVDDGITYFESIAILLHLGEQYGVERGMWPTAPQDHADALSWMIWGMVELQYNLRECVYHGASSPLSYKPEQQSKAAAEFNRGALAKHYATLDKRLADREYVCGKFTLADVSIGATLRFGQMLGLTLEGPHLVAYIDRLSKRPAFARIR